MVLLANIYFNVLWFSRTHMYDCAVRNVYLPISEDHSGPHLRLLNEPRSSQSPWSLAPALFKTWQQHVLCGIGFCSSVQSWPHSLVLYWTQCLPGSTELVLAAQHAEGGLALPPAPAPVSLAVNSVQSLSAHSEAEYLGLSHGSQHFWLVTEDTLCLSVLTHKMWAILTDFIGLLSLL